MPLPWPLSLALALALRPSGVHRSPPRPPPLHLVVALTRCLGCRSGGAGLPELLRALALLPGVPA